MKLVQTMGRILTRHSSAQARVGENCTHRHEPPTVRTRRGKRTDALPASLLRSHPAGWCDLVVAERNRMVIRVARCGTRRTLANSECAAANALPSLGVSQTRVPELRARDGSPCAVSRSCAVADPAPSASPSLDRLLDMLCARGAIAEGTHELM